MEHQVFYATSSSLKEELFLKMFQISVAEIFMEYIIIVVLTPHPNPRPGNSAKCFWELKCFYRKFLRKEGIYWVKNA